MALVPADEFNRVKESVRRFSSGFTPGQKAVTLAAVLGAAAVGVIFMLLSGKPTYSPLYTNLTAQDAGAITQMLSSDKVPYQLSDGGSTILVPANQVDQERLATAEAGLPTQSTVGLTLLDKEGLTTSQLTQQADYLQAIQGELEQTIDAIGGVNSSQVDVAMPADQTFALQNTNPTGASVLVSMSPGHSLSHGEVSAIVHLVASSVPGLNSSDVTVADSGGTLLAGPGVTGSGSTGAASYDAAQEAKAEAYLATIFGAGNFDVEVDATLTMNKAKTTTESVVPGANGGAPTGFCTSTKQSTTKYTGSGSPTAGGSAGTVTSAGSTSGNGTYTETTTTKSCETSTESESVTVAPGAVTNQSVAVLVNAKAVPKGTSLAAIRQGVAAAVDLQTKRGDVLSLTVAKFNTASSAQAAAAARAAAASASSAKLGSELRDGVAVLAVVALLALVWLSSRRRRRAGDGLAPAILPSSQFVPVGLDEPPTGEIPAVVTQQLPRQRAVQTVEDFIDEQPAEVASVLRSWLQRNGAAPADVVS